MTSLDAGMTPLFGPDDDANMDAEDVEMESESCSSSASSSISGHLIMTSSQKGGHVTMTSSEDGVVVSGDVTILPPEPTEGNVEYKLKLVNPSASRFQHLVTQMNWRLGEGQGEAIYEIGVEDGGHVVGLSSRDLKASLDTLYRMAEKLGATVSVVGERVVLNSVDKMGQPRRSAEVLVRRVPEDQRAIEMRIAVVGNVEVGKSTLLGVLTQDQLDNGRGSARLNLFRHLHEIQSGRTSSISREVLGFTSSGQPVTYRAVRSPEEMVELSSKMITFIDLAGHQKYLRTTVFGLTAHSPHYVMLVVNASTGLQGTALDHLALIVALKIPFFIVVNKVDAVSAQTLRKTLAQLESMLSCSPSIKSRPIMTVVDEDPFAAANGAHLGSVIPVFLISCVRGTGINRLYAFLNVLPPKYSRRDRESLMWQATHFQIDQVFCVPEVGLVTSGLLDTGVLREGDCLMAGPSLDGTFHQVKVLSVQRNRVACRQVRAGESATLALAACSPQVERVLRRGTVLCQPGRCPVVGLLFQAQVNVIKHTATLGIRIGFRMMVQIGTVQQAVVVAGIKGKSALSAGETGVVLLRFLRQPECLRVGERFLFHQANTTKGVGFLLKVFPLTVDNSNE